MTDQPYAVYAIRCTDGNRDRHRLQQRSVRDLVLQQAARLVDKPCGPHVIDYAIVKPLDWAPVDLSVSDPQTAHRDQVLAGVHEISCPRCGVPAGAPCENLTSRRAGATQFTAWPHPERIAAAVSESPS